MKTVVHYLDSPFLNITENWIYSQIINLKNYNPIVYCHGTKNLNSFPVETIRSFDQKNRFFRIGNKIRKRILGYNPFFDSYLKRDRPQIVHAHYGVSGYDFLSYKKRLKIPLITTFYGYDVNMLPMLDPRWRIRYQQLFLKGDLFLTEGNFMKSCLVKLGCEEKKVVVQHLGVDLERIRFEPRTYKEGEELKILISGSFREKKGIPYAIEAIGIFGRKHPGVKIKVTILGDSAGQPREEREKKWIFEKIREFGLGEVVRHLGYQPHAVFVEELYKNHIFLSPSVTSSDGDTEGGAPVSIIEASASGMPVISTFHCDIPEVIINDQTGYLVHERDVNSLIGKMELLLKNVSLWGKIGRAARRHIEGKYDLKKQIEAQERIYDRLI